MPGQLKLKICISASRYVTSQQLSRNNHKQYRCIYCDETFLSPQGLSCQNNIHVKSADHFREKPKYGEVKIIGDTNQYSQINKAEKYV